MGMVVMGRGGFLELRQRPRRDPRLRVRQYTTEHRPLVPWRNEHAKSPETGAIRLGRWTNRSAGNEDGVGDLRSIVRTW